MFYAVFLSKAYKVRLQIAQPHQQLNPRATSSPKEHKQRESSHCNNIILYYIMPNLCTSRCMIYAAVFEGELRGASVDFQV